MTTLVATYTREIVEELAQSKQKLAIDEKADAPLETTKVREGSSLGRTTEKKTIRVDMKVAQAVGARSRIFPESYGDSTENWFVFTPRLTSDRFDAVMFYCTGIIDGASGSAVFVRDAYRQILLREVDPTGIDLYPRLVENRQLSQRDVIRELVDSEEARERDICLIVIPQPSSWLQGFHSIDEVPLLTENTA